MNTKLKKTFLTAAATGLLAVGGAGVAVDAEAKDKEKCYGVAKAGANDCGSKYSSHSCAGQATSDNSPSAFILVPEGLCERLAGGSTEPSKG
jgi:uncharacterized membrane protein